MKVKLDKILDDYQSLLKWASDSKGWDKSMKNSSLHKGVDALKRYAYLTKLPRATAITYLRSPGGNCGPNFAQLFLDHAAKQVREYISRVNVAPPRSELGEHEHLVVGTRVRTSAYQTMDGIVIAIRGEQRPETVRLIKFQGLAMPSGGNAVFDVVFIGDENSHVASNIYEATLRGDQWEILPGIAGPEDIKAALAQFEQAERSREQNEREHRERLRQRAENYKKEFSFLERVKPGEPASASLGAVNLRNELASRFPDVHFLIRSQGFAAGDSIDIQWNFGPTAGEVEVIAGKYEQSFYDSRSKCHKLNDDDAWTPIFGGAKYIRYGRIT